MPLEIELPDGRKTDVHTLASNPGLLAGDNRTPDVTVGTASSAPAEAAAEPRFTPTRGQAEAVDAVGALVKKSGAAVHRIIGYAGVGKTTMLRLLASAYGVPAVITPTGKAALRVSQASGLQAGTVHRWLYDARIGGDGKVIFTPKPLERIQLPASKLVLVDEASMVGSSLWQDIWRVAKLYGLKVVLIGDGFQLPPVEAKGAPKFSTMDDAFVAANPCTTTHLAEVVRQAQDSPVVRASMALREGGMGSNALAELPKVDREALLETCLATRAAGGVIIAHTNVTRHRVNAAMRSGAGNTPGLAFPPGAGVNAGEPLLVLRNNYDLDVFNGEQLDFEGWHRAPVPEPVRCRWEGGDGTVHFGVAQVAGRACVLAVEGLSGDVMGSNGKPLSGLAVAIAAERWARVNGYFANGQPLPYMEANYGYCYTAHKSQGSEWPYALVILEKGVKLSNEDGRRWAYTAITRAKSMAAVFYGTP